MPKAAAPFPTYGFDIDDPDETFLSQLSVIDKPKKKIWKQEEILTPGLCGVL
jgi:hypothetical protein